MNIVVPMAGMGKRMRPHTITIPKPLLPIAGKPIVQRLVEDIASISHEPVEEIAFIIGDFGEAVEKNLLKIAESLGAKGRICYQEEALGTAHAILCAKESLNGKVIVAFADTLFRADFKLDDSKDGVLWVKQIPNPEQFGVVKLDSENNIVDFIEKPTEFVSDLAMIGIYYFKDGENLAKELQYLIDNGIIKGGEYQLPDALKNMTEKGKRFGPGEVKDWMDCGNKNATVQTNSSILGYIKDENIIDSSLKLNNSVVIEPCYIGEGVEINDSVIGPGVSIGNGCKINRSIISDSIVQSNTVLNNVNYNNSMVGNHVIIDAPAEQVSIGDYSTSGK